MLNTKNIQAINDLKEIIRPTQNYLSASAGGYFEKQNFGIEDYTLVKDIFSSKELRSILVKLSQKELKLAQASVLQLASQGVHLS